MQRHAAVACQWPVLEHDKRVSGITQIRQLKRQLYRLRRRCLLRLSLLIGLRSGRQGRLHADHHLRLGYLDKVHLKLVLRIEIDAVVLDLDARPANDGLAFEMIANECSAIGLILIALLLQ